MLTNDNQELIKMARDWYWQGRDGGEMVLGLCAALEESEGSNFALMDTMLEIERDTRHGKPMWDIHKMAAAAIVVANQKEQCDAE